MKSVQKYKQPPQPSGVCIGERGCQIDALSVCVEFVPQVLVVRPIDSPLLVHVFLEPREVTLLRDISGAHELRYMFASVRQLALFERLR